MFERPKHSMFDDSTTDLVLRTASKILSMLYLIFFHLPEVALMCY